MMKPQETFLYIPVYLALVGAGLQLAAESSPGVRLTANPPWSAVFPGETVTLTCQVVESEGWKFVWLRHRQGGPTQLPGSGSDGSMFVLNDVKERESGMYQCEAVKGSERAVSHFHNITVSATRPQAVAVTNPPASVMFTGETVTLTCDIRKGSGWRYSWIRNTQGRLESLSVRSAESQRKYILQSVRESDSGEYTCQGERGENPVIQSIPGSLVLTVSGEKPKPVLTQNPPSGKMYTGDRVTLSCGFGGDPTGWEYLWYKDTLRAALPNTDSSRTDGSSYIISSATLAHSGEYRCRAARGRKPFNSGDSDPLTLQISAVPQTHLTVQSGWTEVFSTETTTLRCVIQGSAIEWIYKWYRDGQELPVDNAGSSSVNGDTYTILSADQSHAGLYTCRGELKKAAVHTLLSNSANLSVQAQPQAVVTLDNGWMAIFIINSEGSLTMRCEIQGTSTDWSYIWYRNGMQISLNHTGERHTVGFWNDSSHDEYKCQGNRTDRSYYSLISEGFIPTNIIYRAVENLVRICVGMAVLLFLSVIVNPAFWRRVSGQHVVQSGEEMAEQTEDP